jgi:hypothetical protein
MRGNSVVAYWTCDRVFMGWNLVMYYFFVSCSFHIVILRDTNNCCTSVLYFLEIYNRASYMALQLS